MPYDPKSGKSKPYGLPKKKKGKGGRKKPPSSTKRGG